MHIHIYICIHVYIGTHVYVCMRICMCMNIRPNMTRNALVFYSIQLRCHRRYDVPWWLCRRGGSTEGVYLPLSDQKKRGESSIQETITRGSKGHINMRI